MFNLSRFLAAKEETDKLKGGLADNQPDKKFDKKQLELGKKVEKEHTKDPKLTKEISKDHLTEDPKYYTHLTEMEKKNKK